MVKFIIPGNMLRNVLKVISSFLNLNFIVICSFFSDKQANMNRLKKSQFQDVEKGFSLTDTTTL